jgi:tRNA(Ile)-lysidine synthase
MTPDPVATFIFIVRQTVRGHDLLPSAAKTGCNKMPVVVGVSGGPDSVALLLALHDLAGRSPRSCLAVELVVAHLNHGLRGTAADEDQAFVEALAARLQWPCESARADVQAEADAEGLGIEEAARIARRRFFLEVARHRAAPRVALGHTADDRAETILFNLLRGTGLDGLASLGPRAPLGLAAPSPLANIPRGGSPDPPRTGPAPHAVGQETHRTIIEIVRPLIDVTRTQVVAFLKMREQPWRQDETNASAEFTRNRLRQELLPLLREKFNPQVDEAILRLSDQASLAADVLGDALDAAWREVAHDLPPEPDAATPGRPVRGILLDADGFSTLRPWLQGAILRRAIERLGGGLKHMSARRTEEAVAALLSDHVAGPVELPGDLVATRRRGGIRIDPKGTSDERV